MEWNVGTQRSHQEPGCTVTLTLAAPRVALFTARGKLTASITRLIMADALDLMMAGHQPLSGFHDWSQLEGYDTDARTLATQWVLQHRQRFARMELLVKHPLVAMGVNVANAVLGGFLRAHTSPAIYEREVNATLERARR